MLVELVKRQEIASRYHYRGPEPSIQMDANRKARIRAHARRVRAEVRRLGRYGA